MGLPIWRANRAIEPESTKFPVNFPVIPALRDDPKIVGRDDTKAVGDSVAKAVPFFGNSSLRKRRIADLNCAKVS